MYNPFTDFVDLLNGVDRRRAPAQPAVPERPSQNTNTYVSPAPPPPPPLPQPKPIPAPNPAPRPKPKTQIMYHGTPKKEWAYDIFYKNRWQVSTGHGNPIGVYMTPEFEEAANSYAEPDGAVIMVEVRPMCRIKKINDTYHVVEIESATENQYYRLKGVTPIAILDINQQIIAR